MVFVYSGIYIYIEYIVYGMFSMSYSHYFGK